MSTSRVSVSITTAGMRPSALNLICLMSSISLSPYRDARFKQRCLRSGIDTSPKWKMRRQARVHLWNLPKQRHKILNPARAADAMTARSQARIRGKHLEVDTPASRVRVDGVSTISPAPLSTPRRIHSSGPALCPRARLCKHAKLAVHALCVHESTTHWCRIAWRPRRSARVPNAPLLTLTLSAPHLSTRSKSTAC
jgi:hypothetical protein